MEACVQFNDVLLKGRQVRLRQDRGEFDKLRLDKRRLVAKKRPGEMADVRRAAVPLLLPPWSARARAQEVKEPPEVDPEEEAAEAAEAELEVDAADKDFASEDEELQEGSEEEEEGRTPVEEGQRHGHQSTQAKGGGGHWDENAPCVFVGNLDFSIKWPALKDYMRGAGRVFFCARS